MFASKCKRLIRRIGIASFGIGSLIGDLCLVYLKLRILGFFLPFPSFNRLGEAICLIFKTAAFPPERKAVVNRTAKYRRALAQLKAICPAVDSAVETVAGRRVQSAMLSRIWFELSDHKVRPAFFESSTGIISTLVSRLEAADVQKYDAFEELSPTFALDGIPRAIKEDPEVRAVQVTLKAAELTRSLDLADFQLQAALAEVRFKLLLLPSSVLKAFKMRNRTSSKND